MHRKCISSIGICGTRYVNRLYMNDYLLVIDSVYNLYDKHLVVYEHTTSAVVYKLCMSCVENLTNSHIFL